MVSQREPISTLHTQPAPAQNVGVMPGWYEKTTLLPLVLHVAKCQFGEVQLGGPGTLAARSHFNWSVYSVTKGSSVALTESQEDPCSASISIVATKVTFTPVLKVTCGQ
jgi:hypothetical protein